MNSNMTASRGRNTHHYETVLGSMGFNSGRHYWEITIDVFGTEEDIFIGVCKSETKLAAHGVETPGAAWGWQCTSSRKIWPHSDRMR